ncbi:MAG: VCBS repeat-containing protein [Bacteroidetes bacterium]|nr:VCBS repeat-containing protein [Bacteroidota bacterium]
MKSKLILLFIIATAFCRKNATAQIFSKVTSATNPIVSDPAQSFYNGASWIDFNADGLLDLFVVRGGLYQNVGNGNFTKNTGSGIGLSTGIGNTWADVDNDGDIDCLLSGGNAGGTRLFLNNGNGTFAENTSGVFTNPLKLRGWGSAFGDYNNDGWVDLFIAAPFGFAQISDSCKFLVNNGNGNFARIDTSALTDTLDAYTVPTWSDYDNDGDVDLFIGSGRVNGSLSKDYLFDNKLTSGNPGYFSRNNTSPLGTDVHDGQVWNWIDFDNDGDLDGFLTNYQGTGTVGYLNEMYRNDSASFTKLSVADVGAIAGDIGVSLASTWGDFDNDGDLDCIVTNELNQKNTFYKSNIRQGSTVFTKITNEPFGLANGNHWCATTGDYDNDGDLDLFISGASDKGLYLNSTTQTDFINIKLVGINSNKSAIGAKVRVKARGFWQLREISAQNTFNGMNMLNAHFGFGNTGPLALYIDSILIEWPSGNTDICTNIFANTFYLATEGQCLIPIGLEKINSGPAGFQFVSLYPNPVKELLTVNYIASNESSTEINILDASSKLVLSKPILNGKKGDNSVIFDVKNLARGVYTLQLKNQFQTSSAKFMKE